MKNETHAETVCPKCGKVYYDAPALSRADNETLICPDCGIRESLSVFGLSEEEQEHIINTIHRTYKAQ
ncbi:MAG: hypothetical protein K5768_08655 [Firmicutes bacterium]|nr:hypothetical protein [Bacillota bacterium]